MKTSKLIILLVITLLLFSGCSSKKYDRVYIGSSANELNEKDARDTYELLMKTINGNSEKLNPEDKYIGGVNTTIYVERNRDVAGYAFLLDTLYVMKDDKVTESYKINKDFYENEFYPFMSQVTASYIPFTYQLFNGYQYGGMYWEKDGQKGEIGQDKIDELLNFGMYVGYNYGLAEEYKGNDEPLYRIVFEDPFSRQEIAIYDKYTVVKGKRIDMWSEFSAQQLWETIQ